MPRVLFTSAARTDLIEAIRWYDAYAPHVVPHFREALQAVVMRIGENPRQFSTASKGTRRAMFRRFPYTLVFRETNQAIYVVAVFHTSRDPSIVRRRS